MLRIELIPASSYFNNLRSILKKNEWDKIRKIVYNNANNKCEICGEIGKNQGFRHNLECHEVWAYNNKTNIQKLVKLEALCPICHMAKHIKWGMAVGKQVEVFNKIETVNKWSHKQLMVHLAEEFKKYKIRSQKKWRLDIRIISKPPFMIKRNTFIL